MKPAADRIERGLYWDRAWSLVEGCSPVSAACDNCWAARGAHMRRNHPNSKVSTSNSGLTTPDGAFNGAVRMREDLLGLPLRTKRPTVFAVWTDLFHERVTDEFVERVAFNMSRNERHLFLVLTKRPSRLKDIFGVHPRVNIWLGVTAENQKTADERIPHLLKMPAAKRFISVEPMLGPVDLTGFLPHSVPPDKPDSTGYITQGLDWVICGGESGAGARPMQVEWARGLRDQCWAAGVPFWFKKISNKKPIPADLMIREYPL